MALAYGILAFLPLQRLLDLYYGSQIFDRVGQRRLGSVNGLTLERYQTLVERPGWQKLPPQAKYVALCSYQGELTDWAPLFFPAGHLCRRAELLQDVAAYRLYISFLNLQESSRRVEPALKTGNPALQAVALTIGGFSPLPKPEEIPWSRGLLAYYRAAVEAGKFPGNPYIAHANFQVVGYLGLRPMTLIIDVNTAGYDPSRGEFVIGHFLARSEETSDGIVRLTPEEKIILKGAFPIHIAYALPVAMAQGGCLDPELVENEARSQRDDPRTVYQTLFYVAMRSLQVKLLPFLLARAEVQPSWAPAEATISSEEGERAREISQLLGEKTPPAFRIAAGLPVSMEDAAAQRIESRLISVAHSQVTELPEGERYDLLSLEKSYLLYDPLALYRRFGPEAPVTEEVYGRGLLATIMQLPTFAEWTFPERGTDLGLPFFEQGDGRSSDFPTLTARIKLAREMGWRGKIEIDDLFAASVSEARAFNILVGRAPDYPSRQYQVQQYVDEKIRGTYLTLIS